MMPDKVYAAQLVLDGLVALAEAFVAPIG